MSMTEIDVIVKELGHEDARLINIFLEHVLACSQEQFYSQVASNIFINLDDDFGTNTGVVIEELDDNYGAIVPMCGGVSQFEEDKDCSPKDKAMEGRVDGFRTESKRHSMMLRSGKILANVADFEDEDDDAYDSEALDYMIPKNFSKDEDEDDVFIFIFYEWVDDQTEWTGVKETGNEAAPDWPTDVELDFEDSECKDHPHLRPISDHLPTQPPLKPYKPHPHKEKEE
ncbi:hypothetical protein L3X38_041318 [Prunus dulcis]|uniref:Uncharacterized protein n=1 Tax=Prunus dulcis TaxID=3755 RepID=A0AAD4YK84_PRUDU|nr:hypothetical protein L3X38_041318 [Prunus dulcis]